MYSPVAAHIRNYFQYQSEVTIVKMTQSQNHYTLKRYQKTLTFNTSTARIIL